MTYLCDREEDVLDALSSGRWPSRCDDELRTHVTTCQACGDLAEVAATLVEDRDRLWHEARVPPAGVVWWRAQLRAREEAARAAVRPVAFVQGIAASVAIWLAVALLRAIPSGYFAEWRTWIAANLPTVKFTLADVASATMTVPLAVLVIIGASLLLAPLAIYLAVADE
jgi:hypothetical protein